MNGLSRLDFTGFLQLHEQQLRSSGVPGRFWRRLHDKLLDEIYDSDAHFVMNQVVFEGEGQGDNPEHGGWQVAVCCDVLSHMDANNIFLIDHAWTFDITSLRQSLVEVPGLQHRMAHLMNVDPSDFSTNELMDFLCDNVWKYCRFYKATLQSDLDLVQHLPEVQTLRWYVMDEFGSRINHSDTPNSRIVPFFYVPRGLCYSLLWPLQQIPNGDEVTVDYIEHIQDEKLRPLHLLPWQPLELYDSPIEHTYVLSEEFFTSHRVNETLPTSTNVTSVTLATKQPPVAVYTNIDSVRRHLTDPRFACVDLREDADILWIYEHFKDFFNLSRSSRLQFVNQFPGEQVITVKDMLASVASLRTLTRVDDDHFCCVDEVDRKLTCHWYPVTFNLVYELPAFVAYFQKKQALIEQSASDAPPISCSPSCPRLQAGPSGDHTTLSSSTLAPERNLWILKPWNLGRSLGITVTDNLSQIIRLCDTGPLIASRYITDPVLFYRADLRANVKFDIRYVVLLKSVQPLTLYAYNVFWLRFANKPFELANFDDYDTHFTVMNYRDDSSLKQIHCAEFVQLFSEQYPNTSWRVVQNAIFDVLRDVFKAATTFASPRGITPCVHSRAMYAVDLILEWCQAHEITADSSPKCHQIHPVICEVNYAPDCGRACKYHPTFFNDVFSCLFLDASQDSCNVTQLI